MTQHGQRHRLLALCLATLLIASLITIFSVLPSFADQPKSKEKAKPLTLNQAKVLFVKHIKPLIDAKCMGCHGEDPKKIKGKYDMGSRTLMLKGGKSGDPAIVPFRPDKSPFYIAVTWKDADLEMPPKERNRLSSQQVKQVRQWIAAGAPFARASDIGIANANASSDSLTMKTSGGLSPSWTNRKYKKKDIWSYLPTSNPTVPYDALPPSAPKHPVDAFLRQRLRDAQLTAAPRADKLTLLRRATFNLTGLPPTHKQINTFLADKSPNAFEKLIDQLLASKHFGERMAQHYLDVTRYADTAGFSNDWERPNAWRYRDYVIRAFNNDKPYNRFILEQIAGDQLDPRNPEHKIALGFLRMGPWEHTGMSVAAVTRQIWLDDVTNSVGETFLAHGLRCAKCHDHKFDPVPTQDYYAVQAIFAATQFNDSRLPFLKSENTKGIVPLRANVARLQKIDAYKPIKDVKGDNSFMRLNKKRKGYLQRAFKRYQPFALSVKSQKPQQVHILKGGALESPGRPVSPGVLSVMSSIHPATVPASAPNRRLAFARWIASPKNTLTARVIANRIWQLHFGKGIVATANNFGAMGAKPTHPHLLDYLASYLIKNNWSLKKLHRHITTSQAYQRASHHPDSTRIARIDPDNNLLSYFRTRRLTAEEMRDAMLAVTTELNPRIGGPPIFPEINWEVALQPRHIMGSVAPAYIPSKTPALRNRRTIYAFRIRTLANPLLDVFNRPNADISCEQRDQTTVTTQVFALFNGQFTHDRALALADHIEKQADTSEQKVSRAFRLVYGRPPTQSQLNVALKHLQKMIVHHKTNPPVKTTIPTTVQREMVGEQSGEIIKWEEKLDLKNYQPDLKPWQVKPHTRALAELCLVLFNSSEFIYVY